MTKSILFFMNAIGAASPHAVKKLLALSEQGKTRPKPSSTSNVNASSLQQANVATSSPMVDRKGNNRGSSANHHSNTSQVAGAQSSSMGDRSNTVTMPVDLTAESSSVSSLSRKIPNTGKNDIFMLHLPKYSVILISKN